MINLNIILAKLTGDRQHISIIIRTYAPRVQCSQPSSPFSPKQRECDVLVALQIPIDKEKRAFGLAGAPTVTEVLPITLVDACNPVSLLPFQDS